MMEETTCKPDYSNSMAEHLGIRFLPSTEDAVHAEMPVDHRTSQPFGMLNGGASLALAEIVAGHGSMSLCREGEYACGVQVSGNHLSAVPVGGKVFATGKLIHRGRSSHIWNIDITTPQGHSDEQKYLVAKQKALYKTIEYQKVLDNFRALAEEASSILISTEGIRVDLNYLAPKDGDLNSDTPEGDSVLDELSDDFSFEEMVKEGWMSKANQVSNHDSLSQAVRKAIMSIPRLNHKGKAERDDLGFPRYLDASYVHATLINELRDMVTSDDMLPLLTKLSNTKVWVKQVINKLEGDPDLFSQFYQDFRKDFLNYWIQKRRLQADGTYKIQTISINKPEGTSYLLDKWRDNYEGGITFDDDSIYNSDGKIIIDNARKGLKLTESLNNKLANLSFDQKVDTIKEESTWSTINKLLLTVQISFLSYPCQYKYEVQI